MAVTNSAFNDSGGWGIYVDDDGVVTDAAGDPIDPFLEGDDTFSNTATGDVSLPSSSAPTRHGTTTRSAEGTLRSPPHSS